ncbi:hypothetical protein ACFMJ1_25590, partial [Acinetobacter baumannii]
VYGAFWCACMGEAKADWWAMSQVAKKLGFKGFDFNNAVDIFNEHAALSAQDNADIEAREQTDTFRYFKLNGSLNLSTAEYTALQPDQ